VEATVSFDIKETMSGKIYLSKNTNKDKWSILVKWAKSKINISWWYLRYLYAKFTKNNTVIQDTKAKEILINSISKSWLKI